ncbi:hypothetical protein EVAR_59832_1 [Eumeta japonica]|uniref:Uncharacterized protein n=1 Tax=Eumeta variegata TaxID=151549 RepID=A0A4C1Z3H9_EUMVA|nr:hypothetical protein EVAR_59832_1 [Eumeta japonica]
MMSVYPLTTPLDLWLAREFFKFGPPKWGHYHWTVGVASPTRRRPGMRQHKSFVPHLHSQEKRTVKGSPSGVNDISLFKRFRLVEAWSPVVEYDLGAE